MPNANEFGINHISLEAMRKLLRATVAEHGVHDTVSMLAQAMQDFADEMSDMGIKELAVQAASMAEVLRDINGD